MNFIDTPYLPGKEVCLFIADTNIKGAAVITPPPIDILPVGIRRHADLGIVIISSQKAVCSPESYAYYKNALSSYGFEIIKGEKSVGRHYPDDCAYNVGIVGKKCFLSYKACDKILLEKLLEEGYEIIEVRQGYSKCSICPIDEMSFITGDISLFNKGKEKGMDVLLISNDNITLSGFSNGFFGGCVGMSGPDTLLINGNIDLLPDATKIRNFLAKKNIQIKNLTEGEVTDIGSIIPLMTKK